MHISVIAIDEALRLALLDTLEQRHRLLERLV